jgi:hypothetical protein
MELRNKKIVEPCFQYKNGVVVPKKYNFTEKTFFHLMTDMHDKTSTINVNTDYRKNCLNIYNTFLILYKNLNCFCIKSQYKLINEIEKNMFRIIKEINNQIKNPSCDEEKKQLYSIYYLKNKDLYRKVLDKKYELEKTVFQF